MLKNKNITVSAFFLLLLIISSQIKFFIGFIPITLQVMAVLLMGLFLDVKLNILILSIYTILGLIGLPIFSSGGGIAYVISLSFGFIIGFFALATSVSYFKNKYIGITIGYFSMYLIGITYANLLLIYVYKSPISLKQLFVGFWAMFIISDLISIFTSLLIYKRLKDVVRF